MKIFGIPVRVKPWFFVVTVVLASSRLDQPALLLEWIGVVFVSILIHEFGHALMAKAFGCSPSIELWGMGGLTYPGKQLTPGKDIAVSLAGPFAGFAAGSVVFVAWFVFRPSDYFAKVLVEDLLWVNFFWGMVNLLPLLPLDGGHVAQSIETLITGKTEARVTRIVSLITALGVVALGLSFQLPWIAFLGAIFAFNNGSVLLQSRDQKKDSALRPLLNQAWDAARREDGGTVLRIGNQVLTSAKSHSALKEAMELMVYGNLQLGDLEKARGQFEQMRTLYGPDSYLEGFLLLSEGNESQAIAVLEPVFKSEPTARLGYLLGQALVRAGRFEEALQVCQSPHLGDLSSALSRELESAAFAAEHYDIAAQAGAIAFRRTRDPNAAYNVVCALARAGRDEEALGWLRSAVQAGFSDKQLLESDPDLVGIRGLPGFSQIVSTLA